jgi:hypothetical protein
MNIGTNIGGFKINAGKSGECGKKCSSTRNRS